MIYRIMDNVKGKCNVLIRCVCENVWLMKDTQRI